VADEPVLVVDDNAANLKLARIVLEDAGYFVRTATDAGDALTVLASFAPRVILMDVQLPGVDGLELTRRLRRAPEYAGVVIIALTACAMRGDENKARAAGCDGYITKPLNPLTLPEQIASYLAAARSSGSEG
jgi:two-component system cell cycle response regulator DivK